MGRAERILKFIRKDQIGIEIGPYFSPLVPKRLGYNSLILDVATADALRRTAKVDPHIPPQTVEHIEEVDIVGSCSALAELVGEKHPLGSFDYIVSSHNFEHLPDPIRFLQGCERVLKAGGIVSMAVPDRRFCFDYFRPVTTLGQWLEAYFEARQQPSEATVFDQRSLRGPYRRGDDLLPGFTPDDDPSGVTPAEDLEAAYGDWLARRGSTTNDYADAHCSVFTPASLGLMLEELRYLGLCDLDVVEITPVHGHEFDVHLRKPVVASPRLERRAFYDMRAAYLRQMIEEAAVVTLTVRAKLAVTPPPESRLSHSRSAAFRHWLHLLMTKRRRGKPALAIAPPPPSVVKPAHDDSRHVLDAARVHIRPPVVDARPVCLFVTWSPDGRLWPHVMRHCRDLRAAGYDVLLLVATDRADLVVQDPGVDVADALMVRANHGFDFAIWAAMLRDHPAIWNAPTVLFVNDSTYHSSTLLARTLARVQASPAHLVALTRNDAPVSHLQSYFFAIKGDALRNAAVREFWTSVRSFGTKIRVIEEYETKLSILCEQASLATEALFQLPLVAVGNPTHYNWRELVDDGMPLVKIELLRDNATGRDLSGWQAFLSRNGFNTDEILLHLGAGGGRAATRSRAA